MSAEDKMPCASETGEEEEHDQVAALPAPTVSEEEKQKIRKKTRRSRRTSVSAECVTKSDQDVPFEFKVVAKTDEELKRIREAIGECFLFTGIGEDQKQKVYGAMVEKKVDKGVEIIQQGAEGDFFYVLDEGSADVFVNGEKVFQYNGGGCSFGELALMYNCPRAATVVATESCTLWALDRMTFRHILTSGQSEKRNRFEGFLKKCELFENLRTEEITRISDVLVESDFKAGDTVITQGDDKFDEMKFYLIERGTAEAIITNGDAEENVVGTMNEGDFFGEKALVEKAPRAATVRAKTDLRTAHLDIAAFERLMGPCEDILQRTIAKYSAAGSGIQAARALSSPSADEGPSPNADEGGDTECEPVAAPDNA